MILNFKLIIIVKIDFFIQFYYIIKFYEKLSFKFIVNNINWIIYINCDNIIIFKLIKIILIRNFK